MIQAGSSCKPAKFGFLHFILFSDKGQPTPLISIDSSVINKNLFRASPRFVSAQRRSTTVGGSRRRRERERSHREAMNHRRDGGHVEEARNTAVRPQDGAVYSGYGAAAAVCGKK